ncbi:MAG TPA: alpha/beta fold hydrolase [Polyangiaceae bacterium]
MTASNWILLRGLARETGHYGAFVPLARETLPQANVVPLDFPGTGTRLREATPKTIGELVERLRDEALTKIDPKKPTFVFGMSMGGMAAMEWADR